MSIIRGGVSIESSEHRVYENAGAPTSGASGTYAGEAKKGALLVDTTNGILYINTNTKASPTWSTIPSTGQTAAEIYVSNTSGSDMTANQLVYLSGFDATNDMPTVTLADADAGSKGAEYVLAQDIANGATGLAATSFETAANLNTNAATVGDFVYLSTTAGGYVLTTAPTAKNSVAQPVGYVKVKSATVGVIAFWLQMFKKIGANELQAKAVGTAAIDDNAVTNAQVSNSAGPELCRSFLYDFAALGGAQGALTLTDLSGAAQTIPDDAEITRAVWVNDTTFTSGGSATVKVGYTGVTDAFLPVTAFDHGEFTSEQMVLASSKVPVKTSAEVSVLLTVATADLTAGKGHLHVYYKQGS